MRMTLRMKIRIGASFLLVLIFGITTFNRSKLLINPSIENGETMGTLYNVSIAGSIPSDAFSKLTRQIEAELVEVNRQMSTWQADSEISRFNNSTSSEPFTVSPAFAEVIREALALSKSTSGAFDPTLNPLLNLWGFGSGSEWHERTIPSDAEIAEVKKRTGWQNLQVDAQNQLIKAFPELQLDLGAIAKGYGVDAIANILISAGVENFLVEIGGEVVAHGLNTKGVPWTVGIQDPTGNPMDSQPLGILHISGGAIATSGDYWNYIEKDGKTYSHILNPRTGKAIFSDVASVTVSAPNCMDADGIATALFVMGSKEGLAWTEQQPDIEALFLERTQDGEITEKFSSGFGAITGYSLSD